MEVLLSDIAHTIRGDVISEEDIYKHLKKGGIPVYSSNTKNNGLIGEINNSFYQKLNAKGFEGEITWTTDGNAGNFILRDKNFVFTNVCGKIKIKKEWKDKILPQWLALFLNIESKKYLTSKGGNPKLMKEQVDNIQIVAFTHIKIIGVMSRSNFYTTRSKFHIHIIVCKNGNFSIYNGK